MPGAGIQPEKYSDRFGDCQLAAFRKINPWTGFEYQNAKSMLNLQIQLVTVT